ncbi:CGNR zinc finger domain-containing protein [Pseudonocardia sp. C8]|uniref:CGNR zinc finger domain-containing protein n=1 Tax=Pseudonocardia sp. C8 TaxID=2762759 RepID=UPI001642D445|nr:CGNR zinc finger domain-containing protein [Pseudonocardia sp. C8]MBC3194922.1 CGNR zinc finger domain-containing protein [Pseudonocardia sp. C8]
MAAPRPFADPRPLRNEPLPLDLVNTRWVDPSGPCDLLESLDGLATWLETSCLAERVSADEATLEAVLFARAALDAVLAEGPRSQRAQRDLNAVLDHGRVRRTLAAGRPHDLEEVDAPCWLPAWLAAAEYLRLLTTAPDRIRRCADPRCVLYFYDVSRNGARRWCSMTTCGNRSKVARHYARHTP